VTSKCNTYTSKLSVWKLVFRRRIRQFSVAENQISLFKRHVVLFLLGQHVVLLGWQSNTRGFFSSPPTFLSPHLENHTTYGKFQNYSLIYKDIYQLRSLFFWFLIFVLILFVKSWIVFNYIFQSQFVICYFIQFDSHSFDIFLVFC